MMRKNWIPRLILFGIVYLSFAGMLCAAQQYQGVCSQVKMEILQELTLERTGFLATLEITNNEGDASITDFSAVLTFEQRASTPDGEPSEAANLFFVQPPDITGVENIDGNGIIHPGETAIVRWFIIPKIATGGTTPEGLQYSIGADLGGSIYGQQIAPSILMVIPDTITVNPEPQLEITYFQPRDVDGDDPFTLDVVEAPVPFTLGVMVKNIGYGTAYNIKVESEQPRIVENEFGLLLIPSLIGVRLDDEPVDDASLTLELGDIEPGQCRKGAWDMITSLSGEFTEFKASYTHASELGGRDTSIIVSLDAYFIVHEVLNDQPGRDNLKDFLADTVDDDEFIPDSLYESDCLVSPVNTLTNIQVTETQIFETTLTVVADKENWVYMRIQDPAQAKYKMESVIRSDGKVLNPNNYWTNIQYRETDNEKMTWLNIFDFIALGEYDYIVTYALPAEDTTPPVTTLRFSGDVEEKNGRFYILPKTQLYFTAEDDSPVSIYRKKIDTEDFIPALPFSIPDAGEYIVTYYSRDVAGNQENNQSGTIVVSADDPGFNNLSTDTEEFFLSGDTISVRSAAVQVEFTGVQTSGSLNAVAEVYQGVMAYPNVKGIPSSPTPENSAMILVGGENVDYYRYRLGNGSWSEEFLVSQPISLTNLNSDIHLSVSGRSQYGQYHPDDQAISVSWTVDTNLPSDHISISGTPETPTRNIESSLEIMDSPFYCYRNDEAYYQPDDGTGDPLTYTYLSDGVHTVDAMSRAEAGTPCPESGSDAVVSWTVDRMYGMNFPQETLIRKELLGQIDGMQTEFIWDGKDNNGVIVPPGWYTIKITLSDGLGRSSSAIKIVRVGELLMDEDLLPDAENTIQKEPHAFGNWLVWQDQRNSNWDIFAMDTAHGTGTPVQITTNDYNQERPRTDGRFAVWEDRQADGTWDIKAKELGTAENAFFITQTQETDEKSPSIYWPWVVFQSRSASNPNDPWQVKAFNMLDSSLISVDPGTADQLDPWVHKQHVVWQDFRNVSSEIYFSNLKTGEIWRITDDPGAQYHPVIHNQWIVWADNRNGQLDLYGYNLLKNKEVQLTDTPWDEREPGISGDWVVYIDDSAGESKTNLQLLSLLNFGSVRMTSVTSPKETPSFGGGKLVWTDQRNGFEQIMMGSLPDLQPVYNNRNLVAITEGMVNHIPDAYTLLSLWNKDAGVTSISRYTSLSPAVVSETINWDGNAPVGNNFNLEQGSFLWVRFGQTHILDLGFGSCPLIDLVSGLNGFNYACFPDNYTAFQLIRDIGLDKINSLRFLNSGTGRWETASVVDNKIVGSNFNIPRIAVVMLNMKTSFDSWKPGE
ncbi:MAG: hypothetical protein QNK40_14110 [Desulfobacterales bacterium]|nr:hypothetical protein [Desulfobacterales bacterium]